MRAVVTGASGMVGANLAEALVAAGGRVRVSYRPGDATRALDGLVVDHAPCELLDAGALARVFAGAEVVFHAGAMVSFDPGVLEMQMRVNVEGTRNVLWAARRAGVRRVVTTTTVNTRGVPPPGTLGDENTPFDWAPYRLGYMDSKHRAEQLTLAAAREGQDALCVLPGTMFGPRDVNRNAGGYIFAIARWPVLVAPPGGTTVAHVGDVVQGHIRAAELGRPGARYILGGLPMSYLALYRLIAGELKRPIPVAALPSRPILLAGRLASALRSCGLSVPFNAGVARAACAPLYYSSALAERELGFRARPPVEAIRDAIKWYRTQGALGDPG